MRDKRKDSAYFKEYLKEEKDRLSKFKEKRKTMNNTEKVDLYISTISINILVAEFSAGADKEELLSAYKDVIKYCHKPSYEEILRLLSFAVMLGDKTEILSFIESNLKTIQEDKLLSVLLNYLRGDAVTANGYKVESLYSRLNEFFEANDKESALKKYMNGWYSASAGASWYETLKSNTDTYNGYWCFEAGALAIIYGLDLNDLAQNEYFPCL